AGELEPAGFVRPGARPFLKGRELDRPERDRGAADGSPVRPDHGSAHDAAVVRRDPEIPDGDGKNDRAGRQNEPVQQKPSPARPFFLAHPLVAPEVRPRMNSFWARRNSRIPGASTMMQKA